MKRKSLKKKLGQNTAEYLIMLVLVAVGSIGLFSLFGQTLKVQVGNAVLAMRGQSDKVEAQGASTQVTEILKDGTSLDVKSNEKSVQMYGSTGAAKKSKP